MKRTIAKGVLVLTVFASAMARGDGPATAPTPHEATTRAETRPAANISEKPAVTEGTVTTASGPIAYTATAAYMPLKDDAGKVKANIFYVAYVKKAAGDAGEAKAKRPVIFLFNGGPGAASVWLHLGTAGPRKIATSDDGSTVTLPAKLVDNPHTWLSEADLVFIDPVSTGFSRAATPEQAKEFHGFSEDINAAGEFIRLYLTKNNRWDSPKFLAGESYGTTRAAGLSEHLQERQGISLNGIVLVSTVLNFAVLAPGQQNDVPYPLFLPTYAAAAWQHKKLPADLQADLAKTLKEVEAFAANEYTTALAKGDRLAEADRAALADKLARYTGLAKTYVVQSNLRIDPSRFEKELLRDAGKVIGRFDARIAGPSIDAPNDSAEYDPSLTAFRDAYTEAFNAYVRDTLKVDNDTSYDVLTNKVYPWNFGGGRGEMNGYLYVGDNLRNAMTKNPRLKVLVAQGTFDLATPYFAADYQVAHMGLAKELRGNISHSYYPAGHMMYHEKKSLEQLHKDVAALITSAVEK